MKVIKDRPMLKKLSVIIPMYNELSNAPKSAVILNKYLTDKLGDDFEIVFCDDGSTDGCSDAVKMLCLPNVKVIGYEKNRGKGAAVRYGINCCNSDIIVYTDCDLAYGCENVYSIYKTVENSGANIVIGSRNLSKDGYEGYTFLRKVMSKLYIKLISTVSGFKYTDSQCGIKAMTQESAKTLFSYCTVDGFAFDLEVLILADRMKMAVREMPVKIINHRQSDSKVHPISDALKMLSDLRKIKRTHKNLKHI